MSKPALQLMLHHMDHSEHTGLETPNPDAVGTGVLFCFSVSDLASHMDRAEEMRVEIVAAPHFNEKAHALECTIRDPDGYLITISKWQADGGSSRGLAPVFDPLPPALTMPPTRSFTPPSRRSFCTPLMV